MVELDQSKVLLDAIKAAVAGNDERALWFAWKRAYRARFWKAFGAMGPGQVCNQHGLAYETILKRLTAYEMKPGRNSAADEATLAEDGVPPSMPLSGRF